MQIFLEFLYISLQFMYYQNFSFPKWVLETVIFPSLQILKLVINEFFCTLVTWLIIRLLSPHHPPFHPRSCKEDKGKDGTKMLLLWWVCPPTQSMSIQSTPLYDISSRLSTILRQDLKCHKKSYPKVFISGVQHTGRDVIKDWRARCKDLSLLWDYHTAI